MAFLIIVGALVAGFILYILSSQAANKKEGERLKELAGKGDPKVDFDLGVWYLKDNSLPEARQWLEKALEQGYSAAKSKLRICALKEQGNPTSDQDGESYFQNYISMANEGNDSYQYLLGCAYKNTYLYNNNMKQFYVIEKLKEPDMVKAAYWFKKSAEQGYGRAQYELGRCYLSGEGVEKDEKLGLTLLLKAAENDESPAGQSESRQFIREMSGMSYEEFIMKNT